MKTLRVFQFFNNIIKLILGLMTIALAITLPEDYTLEIPIKLFILILAWVLWVTG